MARYAATVIPSCSTEAMTKPLAVRSQSVAVARCCASAATGPRRCGITRRAVFLPASGANGCHIPARYKSGTGDVLIDDPDQIRWLYYLAGAAVRERELSGRHVTPCLRMLFGHSHAAMSELRHGLDRETGCSARESKPDELISAKETAAILKISKRHAQRLGEAGLGELVAGRYLFSRQAVDDYAKGRADASVA